jgi:regulator of protease activity HflC (stomatin/prohibitin superfamily)
MNETSSLGRLLTTAVFLTVLGIILSIVNLFTEQEYVRIHMVWLWLSLFYIGFSWRWNEQVQAGFTAVLQRFGKNVARLEPGLHFAPLWIYKLQMVDMQIKQNELPDEPENIWLGEIDQIPAGKKPALRVPFRDSITDAQAVQVFGSKIVAPDGTRFQADVPQDGLARRVTAPVVPVVEYLVKNPELFITRFADMSDLRKVLEDEVFRVINMLLPNMSIGQALANKAWINSHLISAIEDRIARDGSQGKDWGVDIIGTYIKNLPLHHGLNKAIGEASEAEFTGRAERELAIKRGEGAASAARALEAETLKGRADGLRAAMEATGLTAQEIQAAEVAREIGKGGNTVVVGGDGFGQLLGVAAATLGKNGQKN